MFQIPCTGCSDCMPCPAELDIPALFRTYNRFLGGEEQEALQEYRKFEHRADDCIRCMRCEQKCSQKIGISAIMFEMAEEL